MRRFAPLLIAVPLLLAASAPVQPVSETIDEALKRARAEARAADAPLAAPLIAPGPGRFLLPGDLAGSPLLTFFPLTPSAAGAHPRGSLGTMLARRFESYKAHVVAPFFRDHFARLDRQIVLVDALSAVNAGADALRDLERTLAAVLACVKPGAGGWLSRLLLRRIDRLRFTPDPDADPDGIPDPLADVARGHRGRKESEDE